MSDTSSSSPSATKPLDPTSPRSVALEIHRFIGFLNGKGYAVEDTMGPAPGAGELADMYVDGFDAVGREEGERAYRAGYERGRAQLEADLTDEQEDHAQG